MNKSILVFTMGLAAVVSSAASGATLLVDFSAGPRVDGMGAPTVSTSADFQIADANVESAAPVNTILAFALQNNTPVPVAGIGVNANIEIGPGGGSGPTSGDVFTPTDASMWGQTAILDSYLSANGNGAGGTSVRTVTVKGIEEIPAGSIFTLVAWGVGDSGEGDGQDTLFTATYGPTTQTDTTEFSGPLNQTYESFTFTKIDGIDELTINYSNANASGPIAQNFGAFGGFSITSIPEPSSVALATLACLGLLASRFRY